ncbi:tetratricopeptide repeat protein [Chloroflexota bacterium]
MKNRMLSIKIVPLFLILSLLPLGPISCGTAYEDLVIGILVEWSDAHGVNPTTPGGAVNLAKRTASGSTGDEEADAAIGLVKTIHDVQVGDRLMDEGEKLRTEGKPKEAAKRMDEAIEKRPDDWSYRISRGALALEEGDTETSQRQHGEAVRRLGTQMVTPAMYDDEDHLRGLKHPNPNEEVRYYTQVIDKLESGRINPKDMDDELRTWYYTQLSAAYAGRAEATMQIAGRRTTGSQADWEKADEIYKNIFSR